MRKLWISALLTIAVLNMIDAFLTLHLLGLNKGLKEINPLMQFALENNIFLQVKLLSSLLICLFYSKVKSLLVKIAIVVALLLYSTLTVYHILLLRIL